MNSLLQIERQEAIERQYSRKHIDGYIRQCILDNPEMVTRMEYGIDLVNEYMSKLYYPSKNIRIEQLKGLDIPALVLEIFTGIAYCQTEEPFTSVTVQLASRLMFSDKVDAILTVAEIVGVLCNTDAFDITKAERSASLMVVSLIPIEPWLLAYIENSQYLPPMVCTPMELVSNYSSAYLTHNDSLILGSGNHHDGDICLDVLNTINNVQLRLDTDFLSTVEEEATFDLDTPEKKEQWLNFKKQSYKFYLLVAQYGNRFHLANKVDKRGRIYCSGYQLSTQGTSFKKACIELYKQELVEGVP